MITVNINISCRLDHHTAPLFCFFLPRLHITENRQFQYPTAFRSSTQHTFSYTGNKVGPRRKLEAVMVDEIHTFVGP